MTPGTHVQMNENSPWPERVGCFGVIVAPPADGTYPQPGPGEAAVLLDGDPLGERGPHAPRWSCVVPRKSLNLITPRSTVGPDGR